MVEMLVYAAGVVLVVGLIVTMLFYSYSWYGSIISASRADQVGASLADHFVDDIRAGVSVNDASSSFLTNSGVLSINAMTSPGTNIIKYYALQNNRIIYKENGGTTQYLSPKDVYISRFYLTKLTSPVSVAIRFSFDIISTGRTGSTTTTYSGLSIMRNTYQ